jgi:poly(A) polymerase|tara:strand:+ start:43 stop:1302 length:1260 start_codon:yes stop_codon:yes gene_type:complete
MLNKTKNIILKVDHFLFKKFGSNKTLKVLENMKEANIIFSYLNEIGKESKVRFVGGCVRKALNGQSIDDIDLATSLKPEEVKQRLKKEGIKVIDTGLMHGTVTAILGKKKFEITTLRTDLLSDGRHAEVEFTLNWENDALRRDFTINAIYADIEGRIFDPLNGANDLKKGIVKFIGDPTKRIEEDYLRILRYFRFFLQYSEKDHDRNTIKSIKKNINGINKISNERVFSELKKILSLKNFFKIFRNKDSKDIILNIFPQFKYIERIKNIENLDQVILDSFDVCLILALLTIDKSDNYEYFCHKYKTSNIIKGRLKNISENINTFSKENIKKLIYFSSRDDVKDLLFFSLCINKKINELNIKELTNYISTCKIPKFPISGDYLKKNGYETGEKLGKKLKLLEKKWIENNFIINEKEIENL